MFLAAILSSNMRLLIFCLPILAVCLSCRADIRVPRLEPRTEQKQQHQQQQQLEQHQQPKIEKKLEESIFPRDDESDDLSDINRSFKIDSDSSELDDKNPFNSLISLRKPYFEYVKNFNNNLKDENDDDSGLDSEIDDDSEFRKTLYHNSNIDDDDEDDEFESNRWYQSKVSSDSDEDATEQVSDRLNLFHHPNPFRFFFKRPGYPVRPYNHIPQVLAAPPALPPHSSCASKPGVLPLPLPYKPVSAVPFPPVSAPVPYPAGAPVPYPAGAPVPYPAGAPLPLPLPAPVPAPVGAPLPLPLPAPVPAPVGAPLPLPLPAPRPSMPIIPPSAPVPPAPLVPPVPPPPASDPAPVPPAKPAAPAKSESPKFPFSIIPIPFPIPYPPPVNPMPVYAPPPPAPVPVPPATLASVPLPIMPYGPSSIQIKPIIIPSVKNSPGPLLMPVHSKCKSLLWLARRGAQLKDALERSVSLCPQMRTREKDLIEDNSLNSEKDERDLPKVTDTFDMALLNPKAMVELPSDGERSFACLLPKRLARTLKTLKKILKIMTELQYCPPEEMLLAWLTKRLGYSGPLPMSYNPYNPHM